MSRLVLSSALLLTACWSTREPADYTPPEDTLTIPGNDDDNQPPNLLAALVEPSPIEFGEVPVGERRTIRVELRNKMGVDWTVSDISLIPADEAGTLPLGIHDEIALGLTIAPDESHFFDVIFDADEAQVYEGNLDIMLPVGARKSVQVTGTAVAPPDTDDGDDTDPADTDADDTVPGDTD